ncbi:MAG: phage antirepressor KilAC domain-containing protein [Corynebacterium provencense]|jgi:prophage antirepressor-like protein|uniref:phage antirepressor KilAC domain-containing protein n=1 Tax=Corynebacterium provencense TaxID=1737425 RepID=UPI002989DA30|nr:phage antirepressor KilAC domain-containing protein [Corynebacterium provencense]
MPDITPFDFHGHQVRTLLGDDGEPRWVAADIADVLGLGRTHDMVRGLDDDERGTDTVRTPGGDQDVTTVTEAGLYACIGRSRRPEARTFRRWINHEVLPSIRRTGGYGRQLTDDEIVRQALVITTDRVQELEAVLAVVGPKANTWDKLAADNGTDFGVADAAKMLSRDTGVTVGRNRLFQIMADKKWIYRRAGKRAGWCAYQSQVDLGRLHERMGTPYLNRTTGEFEIPAPTIRLTAKGVEALHAHLVGNSAEIMSTFEQLELQEGA